LTIWNLRHTVLACLLVALTAASAWAVETVWLDELDVSLSKCGWNKTLANKAVGGAPLSIGGKKFDRGIGTHANGQFCIELSGKAKRFVAQVGLDDESGHNGTAEFIVVVDNKKVWQSGVMRGGNAAKSVDVKLDEAKRLELVVTIAGDGYEADHTDWADARIEYDGTRPKAIRAPKLARYYDGRLIADPPTKPRDEIQSEFTWIKQHLAEGMRSLVIGQAYRPESTYLPTDRDPLDVVLRRTAALLEHLKTEKKVDSLASKEGALAALVAESEKTDVANQDARYKIFAQAVKLRREVAFTNPLLDFDRILFIKRHFNPNSEKTGNHMCDQYFGFHARPGGGLFVLEKPFSDKPTTTNVLENSVIENGRLKGERLTAAGAWLSPELSFDGKEILFAYTDTTKERRHSYVWNEDNTWHIFKVNADGSHLQQITDGPWNDFDPCFLPNGRIVFISERRGGYGRCHGRPVPSFTLYSMNADGTDIIMLSPHETNEWQPSIDNDGMIVYTRWDYVDRGFNQAHHPWITTPDGRDSRVIHGNYATQQSDRPHMENHIRAIPGSHKLIAITGCHHGQAYGSVVIVDPMIEDDDKMGPVRRITPDQLFPEAECKTHGGPADYSTAWPLSEDFYICVYDAFSNSAAGTWNNYGIYLLDSFGNKELLYRDRTISCLSPMPLRARTRPPIIPNKTIVGKPLAPGEKYAAPPEDFKLPETGLVGLVNIYDSFLPFPEGAKAESLRIVQVLPKTTFYAHRPAIGYGKDKGARAILGTVPVESDGSAYFKMPVDIPVYFQAIDAEGLAIQSMRSATYVHHGETLLCLGCHERKQHTPAAVSRWPVAMRRSPSEIKPDVDGSKPFSYPRLVQPVLDKHCVACHAKEPKAFALDKGNVAGNTGQFYPSYNNLRKYSFYFDDAVWTTPRTIPGQFGARVSKLYSLLKEGHYDVKLSQEEMHRIALWLDSNSDFFGSYENTGDQAKGQIVQPTLE